MPNDTSRLEWLKARQTGVGSSDAPNLVGVGFRDAMSVYLDKTEPVTDRPPAGFLRRGLELEPLVARMYEEVMGVPVAEYPADRRIARHKDRPWQLCTPDRFRTDDGTAIQLKTAAGLSDDWGPSGTGEVPEAYRIERVHEMGVLGVEQIDLIVLDVIAWEPRVYRLLFDPATWDWLTEVEAKFWEKVQRREPPSLEWEMQFVPPPPKLRDDTVDLGDEAAALAAQRHALKAVRDEADMEIERLGEELQAMMGDYRKAVAGDWKVSRTVSEGGKEVRYVTKPFTSLRVTPARKRDES